MTILHPITEKVSQIFCTAQFKEEIKTREENEDTNVEFYLLLLTEFLSSYLLISEHL